ncbi:MAG: hypothetical protein DME09_03775 [Candidatus Rokuibacteriota bacterium]|nr:MAG: hypothetical protein DME09_03775 [Candidatus Rokubacteria bacterium]
MAMSLVIWLLWMVREDRVWTRRLFYTDDVGHPLEHVEALFPLVPRREGQSLRHQAAKRLPGLSDIPR